jgi:hypothetical protein
LSDPVIRAVYEPETGLIPCVLLQAALGGDRRATQQFDCRDWNTGYPHDSAVMIEAPLSRRTSGRVKQGDKELGTVEAVSRKGACHEAYKKFAHRATEAVHNLG